MGEGTEIEPPGPVSEKPPEDLWVPPAWSVGIPLVVGAVVAACQGVPEWKSAMWAAVAAVLSLLAGVLGFSLFPKSQGIAAVFGAMLCRQAVAMLFVVWFLADAAWRKAGAGNWLVLMYQFGLASETLWLWRQAKRLK